MREKFGVDPVHIPDLLALVGDTADGYPGISGIGKVGAPGWSSRHGALEDFPRRSSRRAPRAGAAVQGPGDAARAGHELFDDVDSLRWQGPTPAFAARAETLGDARLLPRAEAAAPGTA